MGGGTHTIGRHGQRVEKGRDTRRGGTQRGDTRRGDHAGRELHGEGKGTHTERRLYGKETTQRRERGHTKRGDTYGEPGTKTETRLHRKG